MSIKSLIFCAVSSAVSLEESIIKKSLNLSFEENSLKCSSTASDPITTSSLRFLSLILIVSMFGSRRNLWVIFQSGTLEWLDFRLIFG